MLQLRVISASSLRVHQSFGKKPMRRIATSLPKEADETNAQEPRRVHWQVSGASRSDRATRPAVLAVELALPRNLCQKFM